MATATPPRTSQGRSQRRATLIQGSWEELFSRAQNLAGSLNDEAIPLYQRLIDGLSRIPLETRLAGNRRLQNMLMSSGFDLHGMFNLRDRYDESLQTLQKLLEAAEENDREQIESQIIEVLFLAGRIDEAIARRRAATEAADAELGDWSLLVSLLAQANRFDEAKAALDQAEQWLAQQHANADQDDNRPSQDRAFLKGMRAVIALDTGDVDEGLRLFNEAMNEGATYARNPQIVYTRLIRLGRYADAMRLIALDQDNPIRAGFWRGLALHKAGKEDDARAQWQQVTEIDLSKQNQPSVIEFILSHYYLGDPEGKALSMVLETLRNRSNISWAMLYLAGIGWGVRGRLDTARNNLQLALTQRKAAADGAKLPADAWDMAADLFDEEGRAQLAEFFETHDEPAPTSATSEPAADDESEA